MALKATQVILIVALAIMGALAIQQHALPTGILFFSSTLLPIGGFITLLLLSRKPKEPKTHFATKSNSKTDEKLDPYAADLFASVGLPPQFPAYEK